MITSQSLLNVISSSRLQSVDPWQDILLIQI